MHRVQLHSASHPTYDLLLAAGASPEESPVRELARFNRAVNLVVGEDIVALVTPSLGNGPFHLIVDPLPPPLIGDLHRVRLEAGCLHIGSWALDLAPSFTVWDPRPRWDLLRPRKSSRRHLLSANRAIGRPQWAAGSASQHSTQRRLAHHSRELSEDILSQDLAAVRAAASALSGLGPGLTPAGDDFLAGLMLALWAGDHPMRESLCHAIWSGTCERTTKLAGAYLAAAAQGGCDEKWHDLLRALATPTAQARAAVRRAAGRIRDFGATSGTDTLMGFAMGLDACAAVGARV